MTKILVVDDSLLSRNMAADVIQAAGYDVITANNGQKALDMFDDHQPDCVVTDLLMPVMSGQELIERLRDKSKEIPVFVVSSDIQESSKSQCEALGISGFLNKPVLGRELVACLNEALSTTSGTKL